MDVDSKLNYLKIQDDIFSIFENKRILIHGLGLNNGGVMTALFFLERNIPVLITDLKSEEFLSDSINKLQNYSNLITYRLGEHIESDFLTTDIVIKGPGINPNNKYLSLAKSNNSWITTDIEIFLLLVPRKCKIYAVTGSKGKSTTSSAIYNIFKEYNSGKDIFLGGNIGLSPLSFYSQLNDNCIVILELSSWQLRDLKGKNFKFNGAVFTNLLRDHMNYYKGNIHEYLDDKAVICENMTKNEFLLIPFKDEFVNLNNIKTEARVFYFSNDFDMKISNKIECNFFYENCISYTNIDPNYNFNNINPIELFSQSSIKIIGDAAKVNILIAASFCYLAGIPKEYIISSIHKLKGIPYRLEFIREYRGIKFYNDTTATIPQASVCSIKSLTSSNQSLIWIGGGTDKNSSYECLSEIANKPKKILLLNGNASEKIKDVLSNHRNKFEDIYFSNSLEDIICNQVLKIAEEGDIVLFSPAGTSFGLFKNVFDRGDKFNMLVRGLN